MAHAPLLRNNTTAVLQFNLSRAGRPQQSSMSNAPRTSQLSGSTAYAGSSSSSLNSLTSGGTMVPSHNGGPIVATTNIINQKADASRSLYQICVSLKQRLAQVPGFEPFLEELDPTDPVDPLWNLFRTGYPLLAIYNSLQPAEPLKVEDPNASEAKKSKIAIFRFVQACMKELRVPPAESFVITDLMGNDTSGFVKVIKTITPLWRCHSLRGKPTDASPAGDTSRQLRSRSRRKARSLDAEPNVPRRRDGECCRRLPDELQRPHREGTRRHGAQVCSGLGESPRLEKGPRAKGRSTGRHCAPNIPQH